MQRSLASSDADTMSIFSDVDGHQDPGAAARYLDAITSVTQIERGKIARDELLGLRPGSSVLDVGCGLGVDVRRMATTVGAGGRAVGADVSRALLERAAQLPGGERVEWCLADARRLPHPDDEFDAVRVERTLEHLADPGAAVAEAVRVTRPGGRVCLCEPDWGTLVVGGLDLESSDGAREVMSRTVRSPFVGRDLPALVLDAGLTEPIEIYAEVIAIRNASMVEELAHLSCFAHEVTTSELREAGARGRLIAMLTQVTVLAHC